MILLLTAAIAAFHLIQLHLITVHAPNGDEMQLNSAEISSIRQPRDSETISHFGPNVHCVVVMSNGRFIGTVEDCSIIISLLTKSGKEK